MMIFLIYGIPFLLIVLFFWVKGKFERQELIIQQLTEEMAVLKKVALDRGDQVYREPEDITKE